MVKSNSLSDQFYMRTVDKSVNTDLKGIYSLILLQGIK